MIEVVALIFFVLAGALGCLALIMSVWTFVGLVRARREFFASFRERRRKIEKGARR